MTFAGNNEILVELFLFLLSRHTIYNRVVFLNNHMSNWQLHDKLYREIILRNAFVC